MMKRSTPLHALHPSSSLSVLHLSGASICNFIAGFKEKDQNRRTPCMCVLEYTHQQQAQIATQCD